MMTRKDFFEWMGRAAVAAGCANGAVLATGCAPEKTGRSGKGMKLTYEQVDLELRHTWTIARNSSDTKPNIIVKLEKDGIVGFFEV